YHTGTGFYASQANCTHMFAPLARGKIIDDCLVQCPLHRARFDIATGEVREWANFPPGIQLLDAVRGKKKLQTFVVEVRGEDVFVRI
ncbi:MAG: Rieske 2Fe-2S domain-containing protein, partial [Gammaproteobacteria bacterium]|nr:Rieske 2Fe-2S domain-containing protein [Gammaproteobacteria bacterium]